MKVSFTSDDFDGKFVCSHQVKSGVFVQESDFDALKKEQNVAGEELSSIYEYLMSYDPDFIGYLKVNKAAFFKDKNATFRQIGVYMRDKIAQGPKDAGKKSKLPKT